MDDCVIANWDGCPEGKVKVLFEESKLPKERGLGGRKLPRRRELWYMVFSDPGLIFWVSRWNYASSHRHNRKLHAASQLPRLPGEQREGSPSLCRQPEGSVAASGPQGPGGTASQPRLCVRDAIRPPRHPAAEAQVVKVLASFAEIGGWLEHT